MKKALLLISILTPFTFLSQSYCGYNSQIPIDMGQGSSSETPIELLEQADGQLISVSSTYFINSNHFEVSLFRMNSANELDPDFGVNGRVSHTWEQRNTALCAALDQDEKIYIGGYQAPGNGLSSFTAYAARLNQDGSADTTFGEGGSTKFDFSPIIKGTTVGLRPTSDGGVMASVITRTPYGIGMVKLDSEGLLDSTFSDDGISLFENSELYWQEAYGESIYREADGSTLFIGKIYTGGQSLPYIAKMDSNGLMDSTFSSTGELVLPESLPGNFSGIFATLTSDGDILVCCSSEGANKRYRVYKIDGVTGELDSDFGTDGVSYASTTGSFNDPWDITIDPADDHIMVIGEGSNSGRFPTLWRIDQNGQEVLNCSGDATQIFTSGLGSNGFHVGRYDASGQLRLIGKTGDQDTTSGTDQSFNLMIPYDSSPSTLSDLLIKEIAVYPNPSSDFLYIDLDDSAGAGYIVFDIYGREVLKGKLDQRIELSTLNSGMYRLLLLRDSFPMGTSGFMVK